MRHTRLRRGSASGTCDIVTNRPAEIRSWRPLEHAGHSQRFGIGNMRCARPGSRSALASLRTCDALCPAEVCVGSMRHARHLKHAMSLNCSALASRRTCDALGPAEIRRWEHAMCPAWQRFGTGVPSRVRCTRPSQRFDIRAMRCTRPSQTFSFGIPSTYGALGLRSGSASGKCDALGLRRGSALEKCDALWLSRRFSFGIPSNMRCARPSQRFSLGKPSSVRCHPPSQRLSQTFCFDIPLNMRCTRASQRFRVGNLRCTRPSRSFSFKHAMCPVFTEVQARHPSTCDALRLRSGSRRASASASFRTCDAFVLCSCSTLGTCDAIGLCRGTAPASLRTCNAHGPRSGSPLENALRSACTEDHSSIPSNMRRPRPRRDSALGTCDVPGHRRGSVWERARRSVWQRYCFGDVRGTRPGRGSALVTCEALGLAEVQLWDARGARARHWEHARRSAWKRHGVANMQCNRPSQRVNSSIPSNVRRPWPRRDSALGT